MKKRLLSIAVAMSMIFTCFTSFVSVSAAAVNGVNVQDTDTAGQFTFDVRVEAGVGNETYLLVLSWTELEACGCLNVNGDDMPDPNEEGYDPSTVYPGWGDFASNLFPATQKKAIPGSDMEADNGEVHNTVTWTLPYSSTNGDVTPYYVLAYTNEGSGSTDTKIQKIQIGSDGKLVQPGATVKYELGTGASWNDPDSIVEKKLTGNNLNKSYTADEINASSFIAYNGSDMTKTGYVFRGWTTKSGATIADAASANDIPNTNTFTDTNVFTGIDASENVADAEITLYAVWQKKATTIPAGTIALQGTSTYTGSKQKPPIDATHININAAGAAAGITLDSIESVVSVGGDADGQSAVGEYTTAVLKIKETDKYQAVESYTAGGAWNIEKAEITTTIAKANATYTGSPTSAATLTFNPTGKITASDCEIKYTGRGDTTYAESTTAPTNVGTYTATVTITGTAADSYSLKAGKLSVDFAITAESVAATLTRGNSVYTGSPVEASVTFNPNNKVGNNYEIKYTGRDGTTYAESTTAPTNVGKYTATVALTGAAATGYNLTGTKTVNFEITQKEITANVKDANKTKTYGDAISDLGDCIEFTNGTAADCAGVVFACDASAATAGVGAKTVSVTTQPTNTNLKVVMGTNKTITVTAKELTAALKASVTKTRAFGTTGTLAATDFDLTGTVNGDTPAPTYASTAFATATTHVGDYTDITMTATNDNNYSAGAVTGTVSVTKANYTPAGTVSGTIAANGDLATGVTIDVTPTSDVTVTDGLGTKISGSIKITKTGATLTAGDTITGCDWVFTPSASYEYAGDHNALSGNDATVTVSNKSANNDALTMTATDPTTAGGNGKLTITGTAGADVEYKKDSDATWTTVTLTGGTATINDAAPGSYTAQYKATATTETGTVKASATINALYSVTVKAGITGGTVTPNKTVAKAGDEVTLTVQADGGKQLTENSLTAKDTTNGNAAVAINNNKFTMPAGNVEIDAAFEQIPATQYTITVNVDGGNGTASASPTSAIASAEITLTINPDAGYEVDTITGATVNADNKFTMPAENVTVTVKFKKAEYTITDGTTAPNGKLVFKDKDGNVIDPATAKLSKDDVVTVEVVPDEGYELDGALEAKDTTNGDATVAIADGKFTMPAGNVTVTAPAFKQSNYTVTPVEPTQTNGKFTVNNSATPITNAHKDDTITVDVSDVANGFNVSVAATYTKADGTTASVTITPVTANSKYTFTMPAADVDVKVTFNKRPSGGGGGGTSTYKVTYNPGKNGTIAKGAKTTESVESGSSPKAVPEIVPNEGYTFKGWTIDGETIVVPTEEKIKKATTFTALYEEAAVVTPTPTTVPVEDKETADHKLYIHGYAEDGSFRADNPVTRAEVATMFALALTDFTEGKTYNNPYWDVDSDAWYADYILSLTEMGAITGYDDESFMPDQYITRQEFAAMLTRLGDVLPAEEMPFYDVSSENWGVDYIYTAYSNGWVIGYEDGTFRPDRNISRTEAVKMVNGYLGRVVDATTVEGIDYNVFYDVPTNHWGYYEILEAANDHTYTVGTKPEKWVSVK